LGRERDAHLWDSAQDAEELASQMIGSSLITKQTGASGRICNTVSAPKKGLGTKRTEHGYLAVVQVMLAELRQPSHEYYVAVLNDRASQGVVLVASNQGGMNIEDVAAKDPNAIITTPIPFSTGLTKETAIGVAKKLGFSSEKATDEAADIFINLYRIFKEKDATQIEINPLAETTDGAVLWFVHI
jgi:succinyl-CoA synthetase beta subunit